MSVSTPDLDPEVIKLIDRMTGPAPSHRRFVGAPIDLAQIDALALGDLWAAAHATDLRGSHGPAKGLAAGTACVVLDLARKMEPVFRGSACLDYLDLLARKVEAAEGPGNPWSTELREPCFALARCIDLSFDGLGAAARRILAATDWQKEPHRALALARLADCEGSILDRLTAKLAGSPLFIDELRAAAALDLPANFAVVDAMYPDMRYADIGEAGSAAGDDRYRLSDCPGYVTFAEAGLRQAVERVRRIHERELSYAADKAFTRDEAEVIGRLTRVALERDESWAPLVLDELFRKVSLAPTAAKTVPSQSVAIALGHAVEAFPTPEAVNTLRDVLRDIRHAGVKKKLQRNLPAAERGLAARPEIALRLPLDRPVSKPQLTALARCLEAGLALLMVLNYDDWRARLAEHPQAKTLAASLVWRVLDADGAGVAVLPVTERGRSTLRDVAGAVVTAAADRRVMLWHPLDATAEERGAWRDRLAALQIRQPFKQVFREHYVVPDEALSGSETAIFAGHVVSIRPFLGLARRERWSLCYDCLTRRFGRWNASLYVADRIYPGCGGGTTVGKLGLFTSAGRKSQPVRLRDVPAVTLSEILRSVDLLVSVSGFAVTGDEDPSREARLWRLASGPLGPMAEMRRQALERALAGLDGMASLAFDARHLRLGRYAIHLATGRVTSDGEPVTIELPSRPNLAAVPWLPYDEKLLETICYTALEIARRAGS